MRAEAGEVDSWFLLELGLEVKVGVVGSELIEDWVEGKGGTGGVAGLEEEEAWFFLLKLNLERDGDFFKVFELDDGLKEDARGDVFVGEVDVGEGTVEGDREEEGVEE